MNRLYFCARVIHFIVCVMVISIFVVVSVPADTIDGTFIEWEYSEIDKSLTFIGEGVIPDFFGKGYVDETIVNQEYERTPWKKYSGHVERVVLEEGIIEIGSYCFTEFYNLKEIIFPETIGSIRNIFPDSQDCLGNMIIKGYQLTEAELVATEYGIEFVPLNRIMLGDINGDNILNAEDASQILRMSAKISRTYGYTADIDLDGCVNAKDALEVLKIAAKIK